MTDVLGVCESWEVEPDGRATVRRADGTLVEIAVRDIVSGKPVPPRPSPRMRVSPDEVERRAADQLRARETAYVGQWRLRSTGGSTGRSNSALPVGDPGLPFDEAVDRVVAWYAERDRPAWAQVVVDSPVHGALTSRGWVPARPDEADSAVQLASVARVSRELPRRADAPPVRRTDRLDPAWLVGNPRAQTQLEEIRLQLETDDVVFASVQREGRVVARGRAAYADGWISLTDLYVDPALRRTGLAGVVLADLLDWAGERGATTALLQVLVDNTAAVALYAALGFTEHHRYRYLVAPPRDGQGASQTTEGAGAGRSGRVADHRGRRLVDGQGASQTTEGDGS
jgi:ribosomal protein S18 acetylase RimI-like enzyme